MISVSAYLHFNGNAERALNFYAKIFEATIETLTRFKDGPSSEITANPEHIMHSSLRIGTTRLMISDGMDHDTPATNFHVAVEIDHDRAQAQAIFQELAENGTIGVPFGPTFWGAHFGMLTDQFGIQWLVNCSSQHPAQA